jgi:NADH:ubiquinone oxidoreductase subunit H
MFVTDEEACENSSSAFKLIEAGQVETFIWQFILPLFLFLGGFKAFKFNQAI